MNPLPHQLTVADRLWEVMKKYKYAYLLGEPRTGKTLTALLTIEKSKRVQNVLVLTPKAAISGWNKFITDPELSTNYIFKNYTVMNYEAVGRIVQRTESKTGKPLKKPIKEVSLKIDPNDYEVVIIDESHRLGKIGKPNQRNLILHEVIDGKPHLHLSGTAFVESANQIYYQMHFPPYTPFPQHKNFYSFHREWGVPAQIQVGYDQFVANYKLAKPELTTYIDNFSVRLTHTDAGFKESTNHQIHYVTLSAGTTQLYNKLQEDRVVKLPSGHTLVADSILALRLQLHQIEGGTVKVDDEYIDLQLYDKINYLKSHFKMDKHTVVMCQYRFEQKLLAETFPDCTVLSATSHAEGVDCSYAHEFIIYSQSFSGAKCIQRTDRIKNLSGSNTDTVHYILVKGAISDQAHEVTKSKRDFNDKIFRKTRL